MKFFTFFLLLFYVTLVSCDPSRRITMKNKSGDTAQFIWTASEDSIGFNPFVLNNSKELKFVIPPGKKDISLSFGIGNWSPEYMQRFMHYLVSLEIIQPGHSSHLLSTQDEIKQFLLAHTKGTGKTKIEIVVPGQ